MDGGSLVWAIRVLSCDQDGHGLPIRSQFKKFYVDAEIDGEGSSDDANENDGGGLVKFDSVKEIGSFFRCALNRVGEHSVAQSFVAHHPSLVPPQ